MNEPRRPVFWFLWPRPDPDTPVDGAYVQSRLVRITPRGPVRLLALVLGTIALVALTGSSILAALAAPVSPGSLLGAAAAASLLVLLLRGWVVGTYVSDEGVTVDRVWRRRSIPWSQVASVSCERMPVPLLGLPMPVPGVRALLRTHDGDTIATHVHTWSPDLCWRPEAFDIACQRLQTWATET